jgi:hypothetical protein
MDTKTKKQAVSAIRQIIKAAKQLTQAETQLRLKSKRKRVSRDQE